MVLSAWAGVVGMALSGDVAAAAGRALPVPAPAAASRADAGPGEVVVTGRRGSAVSDVAAVATLDTDAIAATGAASIGELLQTIRALTQSADGSPPIFLLNGQRVSGYDEIGTLPPEAIETVEVLPEPAALKFGYPPTRRIVNFITKRRFGTVELSASAGTTTDGGAGSDTAHAALTRLHDKRRLTLSLDYSHTDGLRVGQRRILPDPSVPFDAIGNVEGLDGGEIDPALSTLAGGVVTEAPVPADPAARSNLAAYAAAAGTLRPFLDSARTLTPDDDTIKGNLVYALPIHGSVAGSISLSAQRSDDRGSGGAAPVVLLVPGGNSFSPFASDVLLYRALTEAPALPQHQIKTIVHAGGTLRGAIAGWQWEVTGAYDAQFGRALNGIGIDASAADAAIAAGADPFAPLAARLLSTRLIDRLHSAVETANSKATVTGTPFELPAGRATLTGGVEVERGTATSSTRGADQSVLDIGRTRGEGNLAIDLPIADRKADVLPLLGQLSLNGSVNARAVSGYGALHDDTYGASWAPVEGLQLLATEKDSETAPDLALRSTPVTSSANATVLDYGTGATLVTTIVSGGNPDLRPARAQVHSLALTYKPLAKHDLTFSATFEDTHGRDAVTTVYALTPATRAILPDHFVSGAEGRLASVIFEPFNAYRSWSRTLNLMVDASGPVGALPKAKPGAPPAPDHRAHYYGGAGVYLTLENRVELRRDTPVFDVLAGQTLSGGGFPHAVFYSWGGYNDGGLGAKFDAQWTGSSHVRGGVPSTDFHYLGKPNLDFSIYSTLHHFWPKQNWNKQLRISIDVTDAFNNHQQVRDGTGAVPFRFQPDQLTPVARTVKLSIRKLFR
jgi:iron complex outermembrane recepter protein